MPGMLAENKLFNSDKTKEEKSILSWSSINWSTLRDIRQTYYRDPTAYPTRCEKLFIFQFQSRNLGSHKKLHTICIEEGKQGRLFNILSERRRKAKRMPSLQ